MTAQTMMRAFLQGIFLHLAAQSQMFLESVDHTNFSFLFSGATDHCPFDNFQQYFQDEVWICMQNLQFSNTKLMNVKPDEKPTCLPKLPSKQGGVWPNVAEDANHPHHAHGKAIVDKI